MKKYDIFISCKSEDYNGAREVYQYLVDNGFVVFFADSVLRNLGKAEYGEAIDEALEQAEHIIVYTSKAEYVKTGYVKDEWRTFHEEKRSGRKSGNIITILDKTKIADLPIALRNVQSFNKDNYQPDLLGYIETKEYLKRKEDKKKEEDIVVFQKQEKTIGSAKSAANFNLKIKPNQDCQVLIDEEEHGLALANKITKFPLVPGEYCLACISKESSTRIDLEDFKISDGDILRKVEFPQMFINPVKQPTTSDPIKQKGKRTVEDKKDIIEQVAKKTGEEYAANASKMGRGEFGVIEADKRAQEIIAKNKLASNSINKTIKFEISGLEPLEMFLHPNGNLYYCEIKNSGVKTVHDFLEMSRKFVSEKTSISTNKYIPYFGLIEKQYNVKFGCIDFSEEKLLKDNSSHYNLLIVLRSSFFGNLPIYDTTSIPVSTDNEIIQKFIDDQKLRQKLPPIITIETANGPIRMFLLPEYDLYYKETRTIRIEEYAGFLGNVKTVLGLLNTNPSTREVIEDAAIQFNRFGLKFEKMTDAECDGAHITSGIALKVFAPRNKQYFIKKYSQKKQFNSLNNALTFIQKYIPNGKAIGRNAKLMNVGINKRDFLRDLNELYGICLSDQEFSENLSLEKLAALIYNK